MLSLHLLSFAVKKPFTYLRSRLSMADIGCWGPGVLFRKHLLCLHPAVFTLILLMMVLEYGLLYQALKSNWEWFLDATFFLYPWIISLYLIIVKEVVSFYTAFLASCESSGCFFVGLYVGCLLWWPVCFCPYGQNYSHLGMNPLHCGPIQNGQHWNIIETTETAQSDCI